MNKQYKFLLDNWKLGFHLIFYTKYFGVNNQLFGLKSSLWGKNIFLNLIDIILIFPLLYRLKVILWRMGPSVGFIPNKFNIFSNKNEEN